MKPLRVFIGFDPRQIVAYSVCHTSIMASARKPVAITPLVLETLPITRKGLTPFTYSRFLVPWLCDYEGIALFMDSDTLVTSDISELFALMDDSDIMVAKNTLRFEWASVMLMNCENLRVLTPEFVQTRPDIMKLDWAAKVGDLPPEWNHLVGYDEPKQAKLYHYTQGLPCHPECKDGGYREEWEYIANIVMRTQNWESVMGNSVHAGPVMERLSRARVG